MSCKKFRTEIEETGHASTLGAMALAHLASCDSCRAFRAEREALRGLVAGLVRVDAPADFEFRLRARIARSEDETHARASWHTFVPGAAWLAVAGCLVLALGIFAHFRMSESQNNIADAQKGPVATSIDSNDAGSQQSAAIDHHEQSNSVEIADGRREGVPTTVRASRAPRREKFVLPDETLEELARVQPGAGQLETHVSDVKGSPIFVGTPIPLPLMTPERRLEAMFKDLHGAQRMVAIDPVTFGARGQTPSRANMKNVSYTGVW